MQIKKNTIIIIVSAICSLVVFLIALIILAAWIQNLQANNSKQNIPTYNETGATTVFGIEMKNRCSAQYQNFLKSYGADYSKCLVDFNFNEDYCSGFDPETQALSDVNIIVVLDSSGSMAQEINSEKKIDIAKKAVADFLTKLPTGVNTGLVVYGHKGSNSPADKDLSCKGIEDVVKLGKNNNSNIITAMNSFNPKGWTPIAGSFDYVKNIFKNSGANNKNYLILVSDGIESCDGDPLNAAENFKLEVPGAKLNVIGFATDQTTTEFLTKIASFGGGSYITANNASEIAKAFNDQLLAIKKDCLKMSFLLMSSRYDTNNLNNLNCWLDSYNKESNDFTINLENKSVDTECILQIADVLRARHTDFWYQKQDLEAKNNIIYNKIETDFNNELKTLDNP